MAAEGKQFFGKAQERLGAAAAVNQIEDKEDKVMTFSQGGVYLGLKVITPYDERTGKFGIPFPRVTYIVNGKFTNIPLTGKWWQAYSDFVQKFAKVMDGLDLEHATVLDDVDRAKGLMAQFKE